MTDKQYKMMDCISTNFINKNFYFQDLKEYGEFHPATLTSLVNLGFIQKREDGKGKYIYSYIEPDLNEEDSKRNKERMELEFQINQAKGALDHLSRSKQNWIKQLEEMGLEFPEKEYDIWSDLIYKQIQGFLLPKQDVLFSLLTKDSVF